MRHLTLIASLSVAELAAVGCGSEGSDKAGAKGGDVRVLRLANANEAPEELAVLADEVERASGGRLRIEFENGWRLGRADAEPGIVDNVRAGKIDLAWVGARAFKAEGVDAFEPLVAPFAVTDHETELAIVSGPAGRAMLDAVKGAGVEGVALLPDPPRRLGMRAPWKGPEQLAGKRIDASAGVTSDAVEALGATPVTGGAAGGLDGLDGSELSEGIPPDRGEASSARRLSIGHHPRAPGHVGQRAGGGRGDRARGRLLRVQGPASSSTPGGITARFETLPGGDLRFSDVRPAGGGDEAVFAAKTWKRER
jgi:hypothetical protein